MSCVSSQEGGISKNWLLIESSTPDLKSGGELQPGGFEVEAVQVDAFAQVGEVGQFLRDGHGARAGKHPIARMAKCVDLRLSHRHRQAAKPSTSSHRCVHSGRILILDRLRSDRP